MLEPEYDKKVSLEYVAKDGQFSFMTHLGWGAFDKETALPFASYAGDSESSLFFLWSYRLLMHLKLVIFYHISAYFKDWIWSIKLWRHDAN